MYHQPISRPHDDPLFSLIYYLTLLSCVGQLLLVARAASNDTSTMGVYSELPDTLREVDIVIVGGELPLYAGKTYSLC